MSAAPTGHCRGRPIRATVLSASFKSTMYRALVESVGPGRPISGQSVHFHRGRLVLTFESVVVLTARETIRDAVPVL